MRSKGKKGRGGETLFQRVLRDIWKHFEDKRFDFSDQYKKADFCKHFEDKRFPF